jgi:hypothetical protein
MTEKMTKVRKSQTQSSGQTFREIEFHPDAMERFERAAKAVAKSPPQHRVAKKAAKKKPGN